MCQNCIPPPPTAVKYSRNTKECTCMCTCVCVGGGGGGREGRGSEHVCTNFKRLVGGAQLKAAFARCPTAKR